MIKEEEEERVNTAISSRNGPAYGIKIRIISRGDETNKVTRSV